MYTAVRRDLCTRSVHNQSKVTFQSSGRKGLFKCLTIKLLRIPSTRSFGTHYLDDPQASRIEHGSSGLGPAPRRPAEQADGAERHWHLQAHIFNTISTVKNCKFDNTLRTRHAAPAATRSTERDAAATAVRRDAGERAASTGERAPLVTSRMEPAGGCMVAAGQQKRGRKGGRNRRFERRAGRNRQAAAW